MFLNESADEESFIKAIFDNPFDATAMLVYADWLQDKDDPFYHLIRAAIASAVPENRDSKNPDEEPFYNVIKNQYKGENFGGIHVNWKHGTFSYGEDGKKITVFVNPTGQIMLAGDGNFHPVSVKEIKPLEAKRTALLLLLEEMVDSHRIKNPHGHYAQYRVKKPPYKNAETAWADHATRHVEENLMWFLDQRLNHHEDEMLEMFQELMSQYIRPLEKMTRNTKYASDPKRFKQLRDRVTEAARESSVCHTREDLCFEFMKTTNEILSRMES